MTSFAVKLPANALRVPVVYGHNRLLGNGQGFMIGYMPGDDPVIKLHKTMRKEGEALGLEVTADWLSKVTFQLLELYEKAHKEWRADKKGTISMIYELCLPSGKYLLMGEPSALSRIRETPSL